MKAILFLSLIGSLVAEELSMKDFVVQEKEQHYWRVDEGEIVAGSATGQVAHNTFASSKKRYGNFELNLQVKIDVYESTNPNAGIQIRSERIIDHHEMIGYQADIGENYWGKIYDESRRRKVVGDYLKPDAGKAVRKGWNNYLIRCEGPRIRIWLNGIQTVDFTEEDPKIPLEGLIALQAHSGKSFEARYRKITIRELPETKGITTWEKLGPEVLTLPKKR
ncbi:MAG: DUF1080 domain-containing protein [Akkermansiaceae bacterium]|jgi:hypothetical protein|nr:DUF1080 domain-containing protein [Akkermansiaceae bacterium]